MYRLSGMNICLFCILYFFSSSEYVYRSVCRTVNMDITPSEMDLKDGRIITDLFIIYLFINQTLLSATYTMTSGQLYIVHNCSNLNKISLSNAMICRIKQKGFQIGEKELSASISANSPRNGGHCGCPTLQSSCRRPHPRTCSTHPPPSKSHSYYLRKRPHDLQISSHKTNILDEQFITRTILALNHT